VTILHGCNEGNDVDKIFGLCSENNWNCINGSYNDEGETLRTPELIHGKQEISSIPNHVTDGGYISLF